MKEFLPPYKHPYPLDPRHPVSHGPQIMPEQGPPLQLERARAMEGAMPVIEQAHEEFARIFGRRYDPWLEEFMTDDAEVVFFLQGGARGDGALRDQAHARARREGRHGAAAHDPALPDRSRHGGRSASSRSSA